MSRIVNVPSAPTHAQPGTPVPGNQLAAQSSLYLRQHQDNPVHWYAWSDAALKRARDEDRPIFLSIGYASCHWCHVMEHEVFEDQEVARILNENFIAIKVDREERPDLDAVYMQAVQALTGRGGWPLSAFLTPKLQPFFGGTYFPRDAFVDILERVQRLFELQRDDVERSAAQLATLVQQGLPARPAPPVDAKVLDLAARALVGRTDRLHGGVGGPQKFPTPVRWDFALGRVQQAADPLLEQALRTTLDQMAAGGLRDHIGGGFFRYTVERTWTVPHFEKMLYDNAQLASLYAVASSVLATPRYGDIARDTLDFLLGDMRDAGGAFYASFDADAGGEEGASYLWTPQQLQQLAGAQAPALAHLLGVTAEGNFEGSSIATRRQPHEAPGLFDRHRPSLLAARRQRVQPTQDHKLVSAWNGLAISALCRGFNALGEPRYLEAATAAADFLWLKHRDEDGTLRRASTEGQVAGRAILDDLAFVAVGLLDLFEAGQRVTDLQRALDLVERARRDFAHPDGGFYLIDAHGEAPLGRPEERLDGVEPSGNAMMLEALLRLAALTSRRDLKDDADRMLHRQADLLREHPLETMAWLQAAALRLLPLYEVVVAGEVGAEDTRLLVQGVRSLQVRQAVLVQVAAAGASVEQLELMPWLEGKQARQDSAVVYVCEDGRCLQPSSELATVRGQLLR
ncbi:MAG: thioredoxin domain-containing protein [Pseudomonadota bacterium]